MKTSVSKKMIAGILTSALFLSGCGQTFEEEKNTAENVATSNIKKGGSQTAEIAILENLPEGTFAMANRFTSGAASKSDIFLAAKNEYLPQEMIDQINKELPENLQKDFLDFMIAGPDLSVIIRPKQEEFTLTAWGTNPNRIPQEDICAEGVISVEVAKAQDIAKKILASEAISKEIPEPAKNEIQAFVENPESKISEWINKYTQFKASPQYEEFSQYGDINILHQNKRIDFKINTLACTQEDKEMLTSFHEKVISQDTMNVFISLDKKFLLPFLAKGNLAILQMGIEEGRKQLYTEAERNGFNPEKLRKLESEILDPWGRTNFAKMIRSFEKSAYVMGYQKGNLMDRESELMVTFADKKMADLFAEIQAGKIPSQKLWLHDGAELTAHVSQKEETVYNYSQYKNTEYPSIMSTVSQASILPVITGVGILATGATAVYSGAQEKARDAVRRSDLQSLKTALNMYYSDNGRYPQNIEALSDYLSTIPRDPKYGYEYTYIVKSDFSGYTLSADPEASQNRHKKGFEIKQ